jgi:hypothetical protein
MPGSKLKFFFVSQVFYPDETALGKWEYFFTARFAQGAKVAEEKYIFFSAGRAENKIRLCKKP